MVLLCVAPEDALGCAFLVGGFVEVLAVAATVPCVLVFRAFGAFLSGLRLPPGGVGSLLPTAGGPLPTTLMVLLVPLFDCAVDFLAAAFFDDICFAIGLGAGVCLSMSACISGVMIEVVVGSA